MINSPLTFYLGSTSLIKIGALTDVRDEKKLHAAICPVRGSVSGVREQPIGVDEVLQGVKRRIQSSYEIDPRGDVYFAIENGIKEEDGCYYDFAIVGMEIKNQSLLNLLKTSQSFFSETSGFVEFPRSAVILTAEKPGDLN